LFDYFVGKLIEALIIFLVMLPGFYAFNVPYAIGLCALFALFNVVPYIGAIVAMIPITLFAIFFNDVSTALWLLLYINVMLVLVGNFISPIIFGKKLKVSSLLVICAFLIGGGLFGILGMLFAPPVAAIIWVFVNEMLINKEKSKILEAEKLKLKRAKIEADKKE
jgi:predicted PurR-regulated permease PerM